MFKINNLEETRKAHEEEIEKLRQEGEQEIRNYITENPGVSRLAIDIITGEIRSRYAQQIKKLIDSLPEKLEKAKERQSELEKTKETRQKYQPEIDDPLAFTLPGLEIRINQTYDRIMPILLKPEYKRA